MWNLNLKSEINAKGPVRELRWASRKREVIQEEGDWANDQST
jgi:hypothetical protein